MGEFRHGAMLHGVRGHTRKPRVELLYNLTCGDPNFAALRLCENSFFPQGRNSAKKNEAETMTTMNDGSQTIAEIEHVIKYLDTRYQLAVKTNDADSMSEILADDFVLVTGRGKVFTKSDLLNEARGRTTVYERQESSQQTVRVWGDTAVITAVLWEKGASGGDQFDKKLWFSDVYKLTASGWKYVFAQSSIPIPKEE